MLVVMMVCGRLCAADHDRAGRCGAGRRVSVWRAVAGRRRGDGGLWCSVRCWCCLCHFCAERSTLDAREPGSVGACMYVGR